MHYTLLQCTQNEEHVSYRHKLDREMTNRMKTKFQETGEVKTPPHVHMKEKGILPLKPSNLGQKIIVNIV